MFLVYVHIILLPRIYRIPRSAAKQTLLGLPRMRELINLAKQLKTPALTVYLNAPYNKVWILPSQNIQNSNSKIPLCFALCVGKIVCVLCFV